MKICWDNLENVVYDKKKEKFRINGKIFHYHDSCLVCGNPFLGGKNGTYCDPSCSGKINGCRTVMLDKKHSQETKKKMSITQSISQKNRDPISNEAREKMSNAKKGVFLGENNPRWDGGYSSNDIPKYDLYAPRLEPYGEECRRQEKDPKILEVKCTYCGKWHTPTIGGVCGRISGINSNDKHKFYCSPKCKQICPVFHMKAENLMKQDAIAAGRIPLKELRNEVPKWIRDKVLELDDHTCQMCGSKDKLQVHHEQPQKRNQMLALDIENCVSMCIPCHVWVHINIPGCRYNELANLGLC